MSADWGAVTPDLAGFRARAASARVVPVYCRLLADDATPVGLYRRVAAGRTGTFLLESAGADGTWSRYSFIGAGSRATLTVADGRTAWTGDVPAGIPTSDDPLAVLEATLAALHTPAEEGMPPLTGGFVGALGWDISRLWEPTLPRRAPTEVDVPDLCLLLASDVIAVDHVDGSVWIIANAINFDDSHERVDAAYADAVARVGALRQRLETTSEAVVTELTERAEPELEFRIEQSAFETMVDAGKAAIRDGEVFQVVLSQRLDLDCPADPFDVYRALRTINPSSYMYYLHLADAAGHEFHVVGSSPETLVKIEGRHVVTYPIAGSRPRGASVEADASLVDELLADPKERAEHVMLVDLSRNDLAKVCEPGSVEVVDFMSVTKHSHIMHITSTVAGTLRPDATAVQTLKATFPAGTLSGAPKNRAIELIDELEVARRGIYGGTVGYFDFAGNLDMAIAIRTAVIADGRASVQAGGGIVADSVPVTEYAESRNKAAAAVRAIQLAARFG